MVGPERKDLSADALFSMVHTSFAKIPDHRVGRPAISLADALMSAFAMNPPPITKDPEFKSLSTYIRQGNRTSGLRSRLDCCSETAPVKVTVHSCITGVV